MTVYFIAALSLGLLGSFHCIAMCGPIALALPIGNKSPGLKLLSIFIYNGGRLLTYSALGLAFGIAGAGFSMFGLQQVLSISIGVIILAYLFIPQRFVLRLPFSSKLSQAFIKLKSRFNMLFSKSGYSAFFSTGLLNGLLPCGLVYMALAGAAATGNIYHSILFMALFALGTFPVMAGLLWFRHLITISVRSRINKLTPVAMSVIALMMIVRGLNLNIPYVSPSFNEHSKTVSCCDAQEETSNMTACNKTCCHKN
jgi:hypothetical protein